MRRKRERGGEGWGEGEKERDLGKDLVQRLQDEFHEGSGRRLLTGPCRGSFPGKLAPKCN